MLEAASRWEAYLENDPVLGDPRDTQRDAYGRYQPLAQNRRA